jgi:hypothetical protein
MIMKNKFLRKAPCLIGLFLLIFFLSSCQRLSDMLDQGGLNVLLITLDTTRADRCITRSGTTGHIIWLSRS